VSPSINQLLEALTIFSVTAAGTREKDIIRPEKLRSLGQLASSQLRWNG
jgi:hypothetical protein